MSIPGSSREHDKQYSRDHNHGSAFFRDHVFVNGGSFTAINHVYSSPAISSHQQQVLDILCPLAGPSRIDSRLLHNSSEYEDVRLIGSQHIPDEVEVHSRQIFQEVIDDLPQRGALHHKFSQYIREGSSKHVSIPVAEHLADQCALLATIILPDSTLPGTKFIVPTLAYQLVQNIPSSAEHMLAALRQDPGIFGRNTETQFQQLFKIPLERAYMNAAITERLEWPNIIVLDGNAQEFVPGSVAHWILQSFSALPVNTITHIEAHNQDRDLESRPRSFAQSIRDFILSLMNCWRS